MADFGNCRLQIRPLDAGPLGCRTSLSQKLVEFLDFRWSNGLQDHRIAFAERNALAPVASSPRSDQSVSSIGRCKRCSACGNGKRLATDWERSPESVAFCSDA